MTSLRKTDSAVRWFLAVLLVVHTSLLVWGALTDAPTYDEPVHLVGGIRRVLDARFDVDRSTPLSSTIAALPVALLEPKTDWRHVPNSLQVGLDFLQSNGSKVLSYVALGRLACIPFSWLGCLICWRWAACRYGTPSGLVAATLWCACPNVLGNGHLITADVAATSLSAAAMFTFWLWFKAPQLRSAALAGLVLGVALLAKHVVLAIALLWVVLWWLSVMVENRYGRREMTRQFGHLCLMAVLAVSTVNLFHLYTGSFKPLAHYRFGQKLLSVGDGWLPSSLTQPSWLGSLPVPFPEDYVKAVDEINHLYAQSKKMSYLRGEWRKEGWWYYYPYAAFVKTPLGTLLLMALALVGTVRRINRGECDEEELRDDGVLLSPIVAVLVFVTLATGVQAHVRYILPALPFALIWASKSACGWPRHSRGWKALTVSSLVAAVTASLFVFPHSLSFFNSLAGGPREGHRHLLDSNIDWSQDLLHLKRWLDRHPEVEPLHLKFHGIIDPKTVGIRYLPVPRLRDRTGGRLLGRSSEIGPQPGWHAISLHQMRSPPYDYFLRFQPHAIVGYSIYVFDISCDECNRVRKELGLSPVDCPGSENR